MIIRKLFKFEGAHIVRNCSTDKCKYSVHGHSYKVELKYEAHQLDRGQMVVDFSLVKMMMGPVIDAFDHTILLWAGDHPDYLEVQKDWSQRWIELPVSPTAEQLAMLFYNLARRRLRTFTFDNGEDITLRVASVIVHETDTGYAEAFETDCPLDYTGKLTTSPALAYLPTMFEEYE